MRSGDSCGFFFFSPLPPLSVVSSGDGSGSLLCQGWLSHLAVLLCENEHCQLKKHLSICEEESF